MSSATQPHLHEVPPAVLAQWIADGEAQIVDVREADERARERIAHSASRPLSEFDPAQVPQVVGMKTVLVCRTGRRTRDAARRMFAAGVDEVHHLRGGLRGWAAAGLPLEKTPRAPISLMRQVQITVGILVVGSAILAAAVSPWWLVMTGGIGAGLVFAGATGTCAMAALIERMPWNRLAGRTARG